MSIKFFLLIESGNMYSKLIKSGIEGELLDSTDA